MNKCLNMLVNAVVISGSAGLGLSLVVGCGDAQSIDAQSIEPVAQAEARLLNVNNEFLPYGERINWTGAVFMGQRGNFFADVDDDGRADAIVVNNTGVSVRPSNGLGFDVSESWTTNPYYGSRTTAFADVTGDGMADAIAVNNGGVTVRRSNGSTFSPNETWTTNGYYGTRGTFFADVTGDGKADAIVVNDGGVTVRRSNGSSFNANETWTNNPYYGTRGTFFADVTGDGKADAIAVNNGDIVVRRSNGIQFAINETWVAGAFHGTFGAATYFADVTGDGAADAVIVNADGVWMRRSNRFRFGTDELLAEQPAAGVPSLVDVTNDGRADIVEVTTNGVHVAAARLRTIKLRFVQFIPTGGSASVTNAQLDNVVAVANKIYGAVGLKFVRQASHLVTSDALASLASDGEGMEPTALAKAKDVFNPNCNMGNIARSLNERAQISLVAARCALPGEILVYVTNAASSWGDYPNMGKHIILLPSTSIIPENATNGLLAHEIGHYLGLPHVYDTVATGFYFDVQTGTAAGPSLFWDLNHRPGDLDGFISRADALPYDSQSEPIQLGAGDGWWCPSGDPAKHCLTNWPSGTIALLVANGQGGTTQRISGDAVMKGLALRLPNGDWTANLMAQNYYPNPGNIQQRTPALSLSQIEQIRRVLTFDVNTSVLTAGGAVITGGRPLLGR